MPFKVQIVNSVLNQLDPILKSGLSVETLSAWPYNSVSCCPSRTPCGRCVAARSWTCLFVWSCSQHWTQRSGPSSWSRRSSAKSKQPTSPSRGQEPALKHRDDGILFVMLLLLLLLLCKTECWHRAGEGDLWRSKVDILKGKKSYNCWSANRKWMSNHTVLHWYLGWSFLEHICENSMMPAVSLCLNTRPGDFWYCM